jgi:NitT/TauT family transport system ATP-binding protein
MSVLDFKNVWVEHGPNVILERLSLTIAAGEFVSVVGPSGAGKSTFLRLVLGEQAPSRGTIEFQGAPLKPEPGPDRGVVFQRYSVFPHLSVFENVLFGLECAGAPFTARLFGKRRKEATRKAKDLLASVGLEHAATMYPSALSGGMQQRLAIAQALAKQPQVLLLDEPFGALDPGVRTDMHVLITELWQQSGVTVLMVTHDIDEAFKLGTRVISLDKRRHDPHAPGRFGATAVYDLRLTRKDKAPGDMEHPR